MLRRLRRWPSDPAARLAVLVALWAVSRLLLVVATRSPELYPYQDDPFEISVFSGWGAAFASGEGLVPLRDVPWEYPAAAAAVVAAPALLPGAPYLLGFVGLMLAVDLVALLLLALLGLRRGSLGGAWLWLAAVPMLGPVALARYDVVPTVLAMGGLAAAPVAPLSAGLLLAGGGAVKLWPGLLLPLVLALHRGCAKVLAGAVAVGLVVATAVAAYGGTRHLLSFLTYQRDRGLEIESVPALPLLLARVRGAEGVEVGFGFGSYQVTGPGADLLLRAGSAGIALVLLAAAALTWRVRRGGADRGQATVVLAVLTVTGVLVFDKVLSAQYVLWIAGLVALSLCWPRSPLRSAVPALVGVLVLTHAVYPLSIQDLVAVEPEPVRLLVLRDLLLLVLAGQAAVAAWRLGSSPTAGSEDEVPVHVEQAEHAHRGG